MDYNKHTKKGKIMLDQFPQETSDKGIDFVWFFNVLCFLISK